MINNTWGDVTVASVRKKGKVRTLGGIKSPILREVEKNEVVRILEPMEDWTKILTQDGYIGYIKNDRLVKERTEELSTLRRITGSIWYGIRRPVWMPIIISFMILPV